MAASLLRWGSDTRAQRLFREHVWSAPGDRPADERLLALLEPRPELRTAALRSARSAASEALRRAAAGQAAPLVFGQDAYPARLVNLPDPPVILWAAGHPDILLRPAVAIVGSRRAMPASLATARRLARDLAAAGIVIVSGMARGVDAAAHEGALDAGGATVAVLGCGIDVVYPRSHEGLARSILRTGCLVSELPPGAPPLPRHFPLRNRIISGLSLAVVVVEAAERSGSLITARTALEQGRDVLAVPGAVVSGCHRGCHALIKDGAGLVETVDDVLAALGVSRSPGRPPVAEGLVAQLKAGAPVSLEELSNRTRRPVAELLAELGALEVEGLVARMAGGLFVRLD